MILKSLKTDYEPTDRKINEVLRLLGKAKKPIVVFGSGSWYSGSEALLEVFIKNLDIPAFTLNMGRGIIPDKYCFGPASPSSPKGFREIAGKADLILLLGIRLSIYIGFGNSFNKKAKIIQVDINPEEIGRNQNTNCSVISDLSSFIQKFNSRLDNTAGGLDFSNWKKEAVSIKNKTYKQFKSSVLNSRKKAIHPAKVANVVSDFLGEEGIAVVDGGDCQSWTDTTYEVNNPGHYVKGGPLGCMGVGIPFALGTKAANPGKRVALITGDGAAGMNFMEIETAVKHKLPFVVVICNDSAWGMTKHQVEITYPKAKGVQGIELGFVEFDKIAKEMGGGGESIDDIKKLEPALKRGFRSGIPYVINVKTDPEAVSGATHVITQMMMKGM